MGNGVMGAGTTTSHCAVALRLISSCLTNAFSTFSAFYFLPLFSSNFRVFSVRFFLRFQVFLFWFSLCCKMRVFSFPFSFLRFLCVFFCFILFYFVFFIFFFLVPCFVCLFFVLNLLFSFFLYQFFPFLISFINVFFFSYFSLSNLPFFLYFFFVLPFFILSFNLFFIFIHI